MIHTHTRARAHTHTHTHSLTHEHTHIHTHTQTHTHSHAPTHPYTLTNTHTLAHTRMTYARRTHMRPRHTLARTPALTSPPPPLLFHFVLYSTGRLLLRGGDGDVNDHAVPATAGTEGEQQAQEYLRQAREAQEV